MKISKIKNNLKKIAKDFDLNYKDSWFSYVWISKKQEILSEFLSDCDDPLYSKYGRKISERTKNFDVFINSKDFNKCIKRFGGQVYTKKQLAEIKKNSAQIKNFSSKKEIEKFIKITEKVLKSSESTALLTKTNILEEKEYLFKHILFHEWIHILLHLNKIWFQKKNKKYWVYDEGLNEFLMAHSTKNLARLEKKRDAEKYPHEKKYFIYAIKFRGWLKDCKTPQERKLKIKEVYSNLK